MNKVRKIPDSPYLASPEGLFVENPDGSLQQLANFTAKILEITEVYEDEGPPVYELYRVIAHVRGHTRTFEIRAEEFDEMAWVDEYLGDLGAKVF